MKFLLLVLVAIVIAMWLTQGKKGPEQSTRNTAASETSSDSERMVQCAYCGTHIPASESVTSSSGASFCSDEHRMLHSSPRPRA
ncbi:hypothetical protein EGT07_16455 [Herbaspirillum sp. HC18]|nr:hypothetical protein EGT07_16455 [Herbaspirillum sp. HC18]